MIRITVIPAQATTVIPAKAGIHVTRPNMDPRFRGDDGRQGPRFRGDDDETSNHTVSEQLTSKEHT